MHHALQIPEILSIIFDHCYHSTCRHPLEVTSGLAALARTCRTFKEPALDVLWSKLDDPSLLARCLPEISAFRIATESFAYGMTYMFTRPLEQVEWDILYSYTRRVRTIRDCNKGLDWSSIKTSMSITPINPLFPNLRSLKCKLGKETIPLLLLPFPSLIQLDISLAIREDLRRLEDPLKSLTKTSPNVRKVGIWGCKPKWAHSRIFSNSLCSWSNIQSVCCTGIPLDANALVDLSHMPALTQMWFMLSFRFHPINPSDSLCFPNLKDLYLVSGSLAPISRFLSWARLPVIEDFVVSVDTCPSKENLTFLMGGVHTSGMSHTIKNFDVTQEHNARGNFPLRNSGSPTLCFDDLRPCLAFNKLRHMNFDLRWDVSLSDDELLALVSAWPQVEKLLINTNWGWNSLGGITPIGLTLLLQTCPSLTSITLAINTRDVKVPTEQFQRQVNPAFHIDFVDSVIEDEDVPALAHCLGGVLRNSHFATWNSSAFMLEHPNWEMYRECWRDVYKRADLGYDKLVDALQERVPKAD